MKLDRRIGAIGAVVCVGAAGAAAAAALTPGQYLTWTADSFISHGVDKTYDYYNAVLYDGYQAAINYTNNETYVNWYRSQIDDAVVLPDGSIYDWNLTFYSLDEYRIGNNFLWWYDRTGEEKYRSAAKIVRDQLVERHPRNSEGGFWHRAPIYANQMWLDGIFMADTFYARWTATFDKENVTAWDDIVRQYDLIEEHCRNATTALLVHGYDESKEAVWADAVTGAAPNVWGRAVGWYFISLLEVIPLFPTEHEGKERLVGYFTTLAAALKVHQDPDSGGWWLVMNEPYPGMAGNYIESSASAMFTYGFLRGMKDGYLEREEYCEAANSGYELLTERFVIDNGNGTMSWNGTVSVGSLNSNATYEYYIGVPIAVNDLKGVGPFMWASQPQIR